MKTYLVVAVAPMVTHAEYRVTAESEDEATRTIEAAYRESHNVREEDDVMTMVAGVVFTPGPEVERDA